MSRENRVAQIYGYAVCLVAVITALLSVPSIVQNIFTLVAPLASDRGFGRSMTSFEAYKATYERGPSEAPAAPSVAAAEPRPVPPDSVLRREYEARRAERLTNVRFEASRSLTGSGLLLGLAVGLFAGHWRWLRRLERAGGSA